MCDYSGAAGQVVTAARRESRIGSRGAPYPAVGEGEEGHLLWEPAGLVWEAGVVVEGPRSLSEVIVWSSVVEQPALVAEEEREEGWEWRVVGLRAVVVVPGLLRQRVAPLRRYLVVRRGSQISSISADFSGQPQRLQTDGAHLLSRHGTYIPEISPTDEIGMINLALRVNVLPWPHDHGVGRGDVYERWLSRVCVGNPYRDGETVCSAAKVDGYCTRDVEEEGRGAIWKCYCRERSRSAYNSDATGSRTGAYCGHLS